jgi:hypothetical protein
MKLCKLNICASPLLFAHTATTRTDAAMAQQQTYDVWHKSRFLKLFGRRRVAPPRHRRSSSRGLVVLAWFNGSF